MNVYRANYKYYVTILIGLFFFLFCLGAVFINVMIGDPFPYPWLIVAIFMLYFMLFLIPNEVSFDKDRIVFKTLACSRHFTISQIKSVKQYFSTGSMLWYAGNKEKAIMLCIIRLKDKPLSFLFFGNGLKDYKELFVKIETAFKEQSDKNIAS